MLTKVRAASCHPVATGVGNGCRLSCILMLLALATVPSLLIVVVVLAEQTVGGIGLDWMVHGAVGDRALLSQWNSSCWR